MDKKESARQLFLDKYSQKDIARILDVSEQTISKWAKQEGWDDKRAEMLARNESIKDRILKLIDYQLRFMENWTELQEGGEDLKPLDKGQIDALSKLFSAIKGKEMEWAQVVAVQREFLEYLESRDISLAKQLIPHVDAYLNQKREQYD
jgi:predicted transcriptional regulator